MLVATRFLLLCVALDIVGLVGLAGCAGPQASGTYQSKASYDKLYAASLDAATSLGYTVTSSNKADGLIVAQYGVIMGGGSTVGLNARISKEANTCILRVNLNSPPATMALGDFSENLTEYINAIKTRVPDVTPYP